MSREVQVRFCERLGGKFPRPTRPSVFDKFEEALELRSEIDAFITQDTLDNARPRRQIICKSSDLI